MLTLRQEIQKLLEAGQPLSAEQIRVNAERDAETARLEAERVELERARAEKEASLTKSQPVELEPGEVPLTKEQIDAAKKVEDELAEKERKDRAEQYKIEKAQKEVEEKEKLAAEKAAKPAASQSEEEGEETSINPNFYKQASGTAGVLRNFFKFFLKRRNLMPALEHCLSTEFNPSNDGAFKSAINKILMFYTQFSMSIEKKAPTDYMEKLISEFEKGFFEEDDPEEQRRMAANASVLAVSSVRNYIAKDNKIIPIEETVLEDNLVNMYVACNIVHFYTLLRYYGKAKNKEDMDVNTSLFYALSKGTQKDPDFLSSWEFKQLNTPTKNTLKDFMASKNPFAVYGKQQLGSKQASGIRAAYYNPSTGDEETKALKSRLKNKLANRATKYTKSGNVITKKAITEASEGDVGTEDVFHEFFIENITIWFLSIILLSDPTEIDFPAEVFKRTFLAMSLAATSGESAPGKGTEVYGGTSVSDFDQGYDVTDTSVDDAFAIHLNEEEIHQKFRATKESIENVFGISTESTNLSAILAGIFATIPDDSFGKLCEYYKVDSAGNVTDTNLFKDYKNIVIAGQDKKIKSEESSADSISSISKQSISKEIANLLAFIQDKDKLSDTRVVRMMTNLPKTLDEAKEVFSVSKELRGETKSKVIIDDPIVQQLSDWFTEVRVLVPRFGKEISPDLDSPVSPDLLDPKSELSKFFNLDLTIVEKQSARRKSPVFNWKEPLPVLKEKLDAAFDNYYDVISDILLPKDTTNWGLLQPTPINIKRRNPNALVTFTAYPVSNEETETAIKNKKTVNAIYNTPEEYKDVAKLILKTLKDLKPKFLEAKTLEDFKIILTELISAIPPIKDPEKAKLFSSNPLPLLAFKSFDTVQYAEDKGKTKDTILADLIHPDYATDNTTLKSIDTKNPVASVEKASGGSKTVNVFVTLVRAALVINNLSVENLQDSFIYNYTKALLEADETDSRSTGRWTTKVNTLLQYSTLNIHLRAQLVLAVAQLFSLIYHMLEIIDSIVTKLPKLTVVPALKLATTHEAQEFSISVIDTLTKAVVLLVTKAKEISPEQVITFALEKINRDFAKVEAKLKKAKDLADKIKQDPNRFGDI